MREVVYSNDSGICFDVSREVMFEAKNARFTLSVIHLKRNLKIDFKDMMTLHR